MNQQDPHLNEELLALALHPDVLRQIVPGVTTVLYGVVKDNPAYKLELWRPTDGTDQLLVRLVKGRRLVQWDILHVEAWRSQ